MNCSIICNCPNDGCCCLYCKELKKCDGVCAVIDRNMPIVYQESNVESCSRFVKGGFVNDK